MAVWKTFGVEEKRRERKVFDRFFFFLRHQITTTRRKKTYARLVQVKSHTDNHRNSNCDTQEQNVEDPSFTL